MSSAYCIFQLIEKDIETKWLSPNALSKLYQIILIINYFG